MKGIDINALASNPTTTNKFVDHLIEDSKSTRELGTLGRFFGRGEATKFNIAGMCLIILFAIGALYTFFILICDKSENSNLASISDFWAILTPVITLTLGYIFGKSDN